MNNMQAQAVNLGGRAAVVADPVVQRILSDGIMFLASVMMYAGHVKDGEPTLTYEDAVAGAVEAGESFRAIINAMDQAMQEAGADVPPAV